MTLDELKIWAAIGASVLSVAVAVTSLLKARKDGAAAAVKIAVQEELQKKKIDDLETSISTLRAELNGVKSGFEAGIVKSTGQPAQRCRDADEVADNRRGPGRSRWTRATSAGNPLVRTACRYRAAASSSQGRRALTWPASAA